ncbi:ATP-dependent DNA helicase RecQ [Yersinia thracica]|uniref:DNA 3'-5' helicase n=1 Tax=Yersinia thracica TaxID=2890319 RepID=A0A0T9PS79_9GAMM|nr:MULTISPECIES: protein DpdF [Yersinia]ATM88532.1 ATP-dependent DNA helicase RecQ [Yersinia frederiksenii]EKN4770859.1 ATP-dependent DNA helicase RecQ [Yersinia enterocolitica]MDA5531063.1 protein DpdF [Yersinia enterocolitica]CNH79413.1 ATP-dependent DNA helicase RecQ [Yersinia thracica]HEI6960883.1 ATP-dependent DNA helicase RecQ [Yersinia enterocolitica]
MNITQFNDNSVSYSALRECLLPEATAGRLDRRALIRDWLFQEKYARHNDNELTVPDDIHPDWPSLEEWEASGVHCQRLGHTFLLSAGPAWCPQWLEYGNSAPFLASDQQQLCRQDTRVPMDHILRSVLKFDNYQAPGQRDAVRRALFAPPGSTLLVNLPTGTGKTLVAQAIALTAPPQGALCLLIAPTTALVMELARRFRELLTNVGGRAESVTAWYSDLPAQEKSDMYLRIRAGEQRLIVTSPEATCSSLQFALFEAAKQGGLRHVIVDEAHIVASWGNDFRPHFQQLGGLIRGLKRISRAAQRPPCSTLLMSATITEASRKTLRDIFDQQMTEVHASHLRPEPAYWCHQAVDPADKRDKVLQSLAHAPRPLIFYVTQPKEAEEWAQILRLQGYQRLATFTGNTPDNVRQSLLERWGKNQLDIMIATSAFGVGMDKNDVRTVIHATVPENMDRFYQEVGRGGRDGYSCTSLLIYSHQDVRLAKHLSSQKLIGLELGLERWRKLWDRAEPVGDSLYRIDINRIRDGLNFRSKKNKLWNLCTVLMMVRAGVLELDADLQKPPDKSDYADVKRYEAAKEQIIRQNENLLVVRILISSHTGEELWKTRIIPSREETLEEARANHNALINWLHAPLRRPLCETLVGLYSLAEFIPGHACGGCPACRDNQSLNSGYLIPPSLLLNPTASVEKQALSRWKALSGLPYSSCLITYPPVIDDEWERENLYHRIAKLLVQLHRAGIVQRILADSALLHSVFSAIPRGERLTLLSDELSISGEPVAHNDIMGELAELVFPGAEACRNGYLPPFNQALLQLTLIPHDMPDLFHSGGAHYVHLDNNNWITIEQLERKLERVNYQ